MSKYIGIFIMDRQWENKIILTIDLAFNEGQYDLLIERFDYDLDALEIYLSNLLMEALKGE